MINCKECGATCKNFNSLAQHITKNHDTTSESYFLKHLGAKGVCIHCGEETRYLNMNIGYRSSCGNNCAGVIKRKKLKEDEKKFEQFRNKISDGMKYKWAHEDRSAISAKAGKTNKETRSKLTLEQRRERFNKNPKGYAQSLIDWWLNASEEQKHATRLKAFTNAKATTSNRAVAVTDDVLYQDTLWYFENKDRLLRLFL